MSPRKVKKLERAATAPLFDGWSWERAAISVDGDGVEPGFQRRPGTISASPLGGGDTSGLLHAPHEDLRHSSRREKPKMVRLLCSDSTAACRPVVPGTPRLRP